MKKILAILLAALLLLSVVACGNSNNDSDTTPEEPNTDNEGNNGDEPAGEEPAGDIIPSVEENTMGAALWNAFCETIQANSEISAEEMANTLMSNPAIQFMGGAMPLEVGQEYFNGFGEYKIEGYESGAMFAPMIGSIPFVGYIFKLADGADVKTFVDGLAANANPAWNVCVTADQTVIGTAGNTVFFLMCPKDLGNGDAGEDMGGEEEFDLIFPEVEANTPADILFSVFGDTLDANPEISMPELANTIICHEIIPFMGGAMEVQPGLLSGFDNYEVTGFTSGAMFGPMMGSIPFVGYVFQLEEGTDVVNYLEDLKANCNPAWNVCVEADQVAAGAYGNTVFFLMCPASFEG
ncbi:MAG: hypothetical protein J6R04_00060 [Clostridia bacterium]|nr:hypothetical protein [Clostridia bacterium]